MCSADEFSFFFFQAEDGIRDSSVTGVQTCALPILLESGGPPNIWVEESIDPRAEFLRHFDPNGSLSDVPDLVGIGVMSDGDQTNSEAEADYGFFVVSS